MSDRADALRVRDHVLPVLRARGRPVVSLLSPGVPMLAMRIAGCRVKLEGPFRPGGDGLPEAPTAARPGPLLHRLTVQARLAWHYGPRLVMDWDEAGAVTVHGFTRGPWEDALVEALPALPSPKPHEVPNG